MKRSAKSFLLTIAVILLGSFFTVDISAQDEGIRESQSVNITTTEDGKVKLKVVLIKGNDETTFEKTYESHDEMYNDPDLEEYGIDLGFGNSFKDKGSLPQFYFHRGPGGGFWEQDDFDSFREQMDHMIKSFGSQGFSFGNGSSIDIDSLMTQFQFRNDNGKFFFNGEEIMDIDSLQDALKDKLDHFKFDFDMQDWNSEDVKIIRRARVYIRTAREEDKRLVGAESSEALQVNDIGFYPNPSDGRFELEIDAINDDPIHLMIVDDQGNEVYNQMAKPENGFFTKKIDLAKEGKGLYVLKVEQRGKALTKRIIVE